MVSEAGCFYSWLIFCLSQLFVYIHVNQKDIIMKKYLVFADATADEIFIVDDLDELINQMYEGDDDGENKFYRYYKVFEIEGTIKELN